MQDKNLRDYLYRLAEEKNEFEVNKFLNNTKHKIWNKLIDAAGRGEVSLKSRLTEWERLGLEKLGLSIYGIGNNSLFRNYTIYWDKTYGYMDEDDE